MKHFVDYLSLLSYPKLNTENDTDCPEALENIKLIAVYHTCINFLNMLQIMYKRYKKFFFVNKHFVIPRNLYDWDWSVSNERRRSLIIQEGLELHFEPIYLENVKLETDIVELMRFSHCLFETYLQHEPYDEFNEMMHAAQTYFTMLPCLQAQLDQNLSTLVETRQFYHAYTFIRKSLCKTKRLAIKSVLDEIIHQSAKDRYLLKFKDAQVEQALLKCEKAEEKLKREIKAVEKRLERENMVFGHTMDMHYSKMQDYRDKIEEMERKYELHQFMWENKITYTKSALDKLEMQKNFYMEQMLEYRKIIEKVRSRKAKKIKKSSSKLRISSSRFSSFHSLTKETDSLHSKISFQFSDRNSKSVRKQSIKKSRHSKVRQQKSTHKEEEYGMEYSSSINKKISDISEKRNSARKSEESRAGERKSLESRRVKSILQLSMNTN